MKGTEATADAAVAGAAGGSAGAGAAAAGVSAGAGATATAVAAAGSAGAAASAGAPDGAAAGAGRDERRTPVPRRDAFGGSASGSLSGADSSDADGRTESPTAMIRIAKIAEGDAEGGGKEPGGLEAGAVAGTASGTEGDDSARKRGAGGGSLRGRGGVAIGRSAFAVSFAASPTASAGSEGDRAPGAGFAIATSGNEGLERRRIGGGWLSGATAASAVVDGDVDVVGGSFSVGTLPEKEIVGAIGAFNALAEAARSGPSPGRAEGGADAAPESRLGLGGGASLRENGGDES